MKRTEEVEGLVYVTLDEGAYARSNGPVTVTFTDDDLGRRLTLEGKVENMTVYIEIPTEATPMLWKRVRG